MKFDVKGLVEDLGGVSAFARLVGVPRTTPYRWIKSGRIGTDVLALVKSERPGLDLDLYFEAAS